jgi:hypothetical protein
VGRERANKGGEGEESKGGGGDECWPACLLVRARGGEKACLLQLTGALMSPLSSR